MKSKQIVVGIVGVIVGFILGFFVAQGTQKPAAMSASAQEGGIPENHPSPETMEKLKVLMEQANADSQNREARVALGNLFYDIGRFDNAVQWYEQALALDPKDVHVSTDLGTAYLYLGNAAKAVERYQGSLLIEPDHAQTLHNLGVAQFSENKYQEAVDTWERLASIHPDYPHMEDLKEQIATARQHVSAGSTSK